ncbi:unnamed protein product [Parajaminaea phylloscopi]
MGCICSCFASVFMWTGELLENVFLALGEIGSILVRGIFTLLVGLCDVLAAASCCWRVPYDERPDRNTYVFSAASAGGGNNNVNALALPPTSPAAGRIGVLRSWFTKDGREARKQERDARKRARELQVAEIRQAKVAEKAKTQTQDGQATQEAAAEAASQREEPATNDAAVSATSTPAAQ